MYTCKFSCLLVLRLWRYGSSTGENEEKHGNSENWTSFTPVLRAFLDFFSDIISFQHVPHFGDGISQIEWN